MKKYCVIGNPAKHSLSPAIHNELFRLYGIADAMYEARELAPEGLAGFIANLSAEGICGFNVTMPYKQALLEYIDFADESARNGVNTVVVKENLLYGYSTDAAGFKKSLHDIGRGYRDKTIVFIGCGAVTKSLVQAAQCSGAKKITLLNRTLSRAAALADGKTIFADSMEAIENHMPCCDLLINTTPIGMQNSGLEFESLDFIELLPESACVCDLIYYPKETKLLSRARRRGLSALNGLPMLIWQAFYAFRHFTGILPAEKEYQTILRIVRENLR